jgi:hypothetical protein
MNLQVRFSGQRFFIERATLWLYPNLEALLVSDGSVNVSVDSAGTIEGSLFDARVRRLANGTILSAPWIEFSQQVSEKDLLSGVVDITMDRYREVRIKVRDKEGRPLGGRIGFVRFQKEGGVDLTADEHGEVRLLLSPGNYGARSAGGSPVQFEVRAGEGEQVVELIGPA